MTTAMASYHFFLPYIFDWASEVKSLHPNVTWALFSLNVFFSTLLLALGIATIVGVVWRRIHQRTYLATALTGALFWIVNGCYQVMIPMPMPARMWFWSLFLKTFAFAVALSFLIPVATIIRQRRRDPSYYR